MPSFTQRISNLEQLGPVIEVILTPSITYVNALGLKINSLKSLKINAMIDTGATGTAISQGIASNLGIKPIGSIFINTPTSTKIQCLQYDMQFIFPNYINIPSIIITEAPLEGQHIQCLIGRDILKYAVLVYVGHDNTFTLSF